MKRALVSFLAGMTGILIGSVMASCTPVAATADQPTSYITPEEASKINGNSWEQERVNIFKDKDTGCEYLVFTGYNSNATALPRYSDQGRDIKGCNQ